MGLIKAALGAAGGVLADLWKEFFYCEAIPADVLAVKGKKKVTGLSLIHIFRYYIDGHEIADIPDLAFISMSTVRKHNRSIYEKLGVASRDELMLYIDLLRRCGRLSELF